jgi:hypothetical protein
MPVHLVAGANTGVGKRRKLGSRISQAAGRGGGNFLTAEIAHTARREAAYREIGALIDAERLATNLLSRMPLTFNLLAPWGHSPERASSYLIELLPAFTGAARQLLSRPRQSEIHGRQHRLRRVARVKRRVRCNELWGGPSREVSSIFEGGLGWLKRSGAKRTIFRRSISRASLTMSKESGSKSSGTPKSARLCSMRMDPARRRPARSRSNGDAGLPHAPGR